MYLFFSQILFHYRLLQDIKGFPRWLSGEEPAIVGDTEDVCSIPGLGRSPGGGNCNSLQFSFLENPTKEPGGLQSVGWQRVGCI